AIIMTHGDDQGLVLPPRLAPIQVVVVPIYKNDAEKSQVMLAVEKIRQELIQEGMQGRVRIDDREEVTPGFKFNDWEMRGVPLRIEVGPKDVSRNSVVFARRDVPGKEGKSFVQNNRLGQQVKDILATIQNSLYEKALAFRTAHTFEPQDFEELRHVVQEGWAYTWWCGNTECEAKIKDETKASARCIPLEQPGGEGKCLCCGQTSTKRVYYGRAY
ncbi:MAG: proline--tRNA ligase anticodon binding domain-containing protein, partial [Omnitrophica WOR_2 bacterium]